MDLYQYVLSIVVFCVVLFFYLHIQFHLKTSNELEIYEMDNPSKDKFEEICDLRQPVIINCDEDTSKIINTSNKNFLLESYPVFEVKIRETYDNQQQKLSNGDAELYVPLPFHIAEKLFVNDTMSSYISENNQDFLNETGAVKSLSYNDAFLRPYLVSNCYYDILMGSQGAETPFKYELNYRNYFMVTQGSIKIKLAPPKSIKYLYPIYDYENLEFRSQINPWNPQTKYKIDFDKIKCLELTLEPGHILYIPAYWWYSFQYSNNQNTITSVSCLKYRTYMNNLAICPSIFMYALQNQNVERKIAKKIDIKHLQQTENANEENTTNNNKSIVNSDNINTNNQFNQNQLNQDQIIINNNNNQSATPISELNTDNSIPDILIPQDTEMPLYM
jgi:hypothetical protein